MNDKIKRLHTHQPEVLNCQSFRPCDFTVDFINCDVTQEALEVVPFADHGHSYNASSAASTVYNIELLFSSRDLAHRNPVGEALSYRVVMRTPALQQLSDISAFRVHRTSENAADCSPLLLHSTENEILTDAEDRLELKDICSCFGQDLDQGAVGLGKSICDLLP